MRVLTPTELIEVSIYHRINYYVNSIFIFDVSFYFTNVPVTVNSFQDFQLFVYFFHEKSFDFNLVVDNSFNVQIHFVDFLQTFFSQTTFVTSVCFHVHQTSLEIESTLKRKEFAPQETYFIKNLLYGERNQNILTSLLPLFMYPFSLNFWQLEAVVVQYSVLFF